MVHPMHQKKRLSLAKAPDYSIKHDVAAVAGTGATSTLPAAGAGLFHYITHIE